MLENEVLHALYWEFVKFHWKWGFAPPHIYPMCGAKPPQNNRHWDLTPTNAHTQYQKNLLIFVECTQESVLKTDILPHFCPIFAHNCPTCGAKPPQNNRRWDLTPTNAHTKYENNRCIFVTCRVHTRKCLRTRRRRRRRRRRTRNDRWSHIPPTLVRGVQKNTMLATLLWSVSSFARNSGQQLFTHKLFTNLVLSFYLNTLRRCIATVKFASITMNLKFFVYKNQAHCPVKRNLCIYHKMLYPYSNITSLALIVINL